MKNLRTLTSAQIADLNPNRTFKKWSQSKDKLITRICKDLGITETELEALAFPPAFTHIEKSKSLLVIVESAEELEAKIEECDKNLSEIEEEEKQIEEELKALDAHHEKPIKEVKKPTRVAKVTKGTFGGLLSPFIVDQLMKTDENGIGLSYSEIVERVHAEFPSAVTKNTTVAWYVAHIKNGEYRGEMIGKLPEKRKRSTRKTKSKV